ncbi:uncharacterized protein LOC143202631 [Rhynchophorus ferrugineus]|uniref:uncharacterized protein LOC143202631 n=1 Tax=Rhynchophorus ferrugineus TaxID=354439 RepID=UPI003FCCDD38
MSFEEEVFSATDTCVCLCDKISRKTTEEACSNQLKNWESWMQRRRDIHAKLKKIGRQPGELLMNIGDEYRPLLEDKIALESTNISTDFDKYRGNPTFWTMSCSLSGKKKPYKGSEYFAVKSKEERNELPEIERIGIPNSMLLEKDILPRKRNLLNHWINKNEYRKEVIDKFRSKLSKINPYNPDFSDLVIQGHKIQQKHCNNSEEKPTKEYQPVDVPIAPSELSPRKQDKSPKVSLKINKTEFYQDMVMPAHGFKFSIIFEHDIDNQLPTERIITFENTGRAVLRLYWKLFPKTRLFREFAETHETIFHPFKFQNGEILLLPGQQIHFPIWFQTKKLGNFHERWEIYTVPRLWSDDHKVLINLIGFVTIGDFEQKARMINERLERRVQETLADDILNEIICKGNYSLETATPFFDYTEKEMFESKNLNENKYYGSKPKYIYKKSIIDALKELYAETKENGDADTWNLSVKTLRFMVRKKDLSEWFQNNFAAYMKFKQCRVLARNDNVAGEKAKNVKDEKLSSAKTKVGKELSTTAITSTENKNNYYQKLQDLLCKLERPSSEPNVDRKKYFFAYIVLRMHLTKTFSNLETLDMEGSGADTDGLCEVQQLLLPMIDNLQDRMSFEKMEEQYILRTKRVAQDISSSQVRPKSVLMQGLDVLDTKKVFRMYFGKEDAKERTSKKTVGIDDKSSKKTTTSSKKNKSKTNTQVVDINANVGYFDAFSEKYDADESRKIPFGIEICHRRTNETAYKQKYLLVYTSLCAAIDDIVMVVEFTKDNIISPVLLSNIQESEYPGKLTSCPKINERPSQISDETKSLTDMKYFDWMIDTNWRNNKDTKKYFIDEEIPLRNYSKISQHTIRSEPELSSSLENVFSLETFRVKPEPYCVKDKELQVSLSETNAQNNVNKSKSSTGESVSNNLGSSSSRNIFYFLNDDSCEESTSSREGVDNYNSVSSSHQQI